MIAVQLALLHLIVKLNPTWDNIPLAHNTLYHWLIYKFWKWNNFRAYLRFLFIFAAVFSGLTVLNAFVLHSSFYPEALGYMAVLIEGCLGVPQFIHNSLNGSVKGLRYTLCNVV
jgi:hypothetical protein